jgi:signal transduction histidine kinase
MQTLAQIAQLAVAAELPPRDRASHIHRLAGEQLAALNRVLAADDTQRAGLIDGLQRLRRRFQGQSLDVELRARELAADPPRAVTDGLLDATLEALTNVRKHAGVNHVVVRAATTGQGHEVVIHDSGRGFNAAAKYSGMGIPQSIIQRMSEIGGHAQVWSEPGRGTRIRLTVDFGSARKVGGIGLAPHAAIALSPNRFTSVDALTNQALAWFVVAALAYRVALSPLQLGNLFQNIDVSRARLFLSAIIGVFSFDIFLLVALLTGKFARLFRSRVFLVADLCLAAGLNLWTAFVLPPGTAFLPGHEVLWGYTLGAAAFWTGLRGPRTGLAIVLGGFVLQLAMAYLSNAALDHAVWEQIVARQGWLTSAFAIAWLLTWLARRGAQQAVGDGLKTGLAIERAWVIRDLHSQAAKSLAAIAEKADSFNADYVLMDIRGTALNEIERLRSAIDQERRSGEPRLARELHNVANQFHRSGLRVEVVTSQLSCDPPDAVGEALLAAAAEALRGVVKYAAVPHAVIRASNISEGFEVVIRDHGSGSPLQARTCGGLIRRRMANMGGEAEIWSEPGSGTRVRLRWQPPI